MLFNSPEFVLAFLPLTLLGFFWLGRIRPLLAALWLALASLFFYAWWIPQFLALLLGSIVFNYFMGRQIARHRNHAKRLTVLAITVDLALLAYYKYANFFLDTANGAFDLHLPLAHIILPIGISFYTFTQIAFLVDVYRGIAREYNFVHYALFVSYFPHLIAGPILHHKQMMPQFAAAETYRPQREKIVGGLIIFIIGLAKKIVLADGLAGYATPVFAAADRGVTITFFDGWGGVLAYAFQLYFDFSGYSDMAVGLSRMFGIDLPLNFNSPYKAASIIDFWRRWHMTLSQFLRDYLYIPLGGGRKGPVRRYANLLITMLLGGLWHGASWTFVVWGGLHGAFLVINHLWRSAVSDRLTRPVHPIWSRLGVVATFVSVCFAWVFFRATTFEGATKILQGMIGMNGFVLPEQVLALVPVLGRFIDSTGSMPLLGNGQVMGVLEQVCFIVLGFLVCWGFSNTQSMSPRLKFISVVLTIGLVVQGLFFSHAPSEFLYFQF